MENRMSGSIIKTLLFVFFSAVISISAQNKPEIISLEGNWSFAYRDTFVADKPELPESSDYLAEIPVPGYWDDYEEILTGSPLNKMLKRNPDYKPIDFSILKEERQRVPVGSLPWIKGVGFYKRFVNITSFESGSFVTLEIGGASQETWVWINGEYAGYHLGWSTPFSFQIGDFLSDGENEIIIAVSNIKEVKNGGFALTGYKGRSGGIYRPVNIKIAGRKEIGSLFIYPDNNLEKLTWRVKLRGPSEKSRLEWAIYDKKSGSRVAEGEQFTNRDAMMWNTGIFNMATWDENNPDLYTIKLKLYDDEILSDTLDQDFGLRRLVRKGINLYLNGEPVYLRGVTDHCYWAETCTPPVNKEYYKKIIGRLREAGFNWIRFHTWIPPVEYLQAADETGMLMMIEAPEVYRHKEWEELLKTCRTHPSAVIYSGGNEQLLDEGKIEYLAEIAELQKKFAPDALFNPQEALRGIEYYWRLSDLGKDTTSNPFFHNFSRLNRLKEFSDVFGQYGWGYLSYWSERGDRNFLDKRMTVYERPCFSHEVGIKGNYINLDHQGRMEETRIGAERYKSARQNLKEAGLLHKASDYYNNSCAWLAQLRKQSVETVRKSKYYRGYDFLGGHDHNQIGGGYEAGFLNEFFELKPGGSFEELRKFNRESVLLLDIGNERNFAAGEKFSAAVLFSHWGKSPVNKGHLAWLLKDENSNVLSRGDIAEISAAPGNLYEYDSLKFFMPQLEKPKKLKIELRLTADNIDLANDWDIWLYPENNIKLPDLRRGKKQPDGNVMIVDTLDKKATDFLEKGGFLIYLGSRDFPSKSLRYSLGLAGRTHGNLATLITDHPVMNNFPHEGWCGRQFIDLFSDAYTVVFNESSLPFKPVIEVVSSYKYIIRQAAMFEFIVGQGRIFVCSLNLNEDNPAANLLMKNMLDYAGNPLLYKDAPKISIDNLRTFGKVDINEKEIDDKDENRKGNVDEL